MVAGDRLLRDSNLELLRIVAMFLVLVVHADFLSLGRPTWVEIQSVPLASYTRFFIQSLSIVCVNVFILISGWFGIRPSVKSFSNFIFQCLFFSIGLYVVFILTGKNQFSLKGLAGCLFFKGYWFIYAYIGLYILAPILNAFVNTIKEGQIKLFLMVFFLFQTMYGWSNFASIFDRGYSTMSFIGLYVLGRYLRLYTKAQIPPLFWIMTYLSVSIITTILAVFIPFLDMYSYVSPLVIIASVCLFMSFATLKIKSSKIINWMAASSFSIYLLHINPNGSFGIFRRIVNKIYAATDGVVCILEIGLILIGIALFAIIIDQIRILLWNCLQHIMNQACKKYELIRRIWFYKSTI